MRAPFRQRGVALVLVIWLAALLMVIASSFIFAARTDSLVIRNTLSMVRAEAVADAAVHRAVFETYRSDNAPEIWKRDGAPREWSFDGVSVVVELRDESAKIDVNTASDALLRGLLVSVGLEDGEADKLLDAILDWRDQDTLRRPNGAEEPEYRAAGLTYAPANSPFQAIEELQLVLGMRPDIYRRLAPLATVYSRQAGVYPNTAPREVLMAIPGMTSEVVDAYLERREAARAAGQPIPSFPEAGAYSGPPTSLIASIRATARLEDGTVFVRDAVALLRPTPQRQVTFLAWRAATAPDDPKPATGEGAAR